MGGNAQELIKSGVCTISDASAACEDVMLYLIHKGFPQLEAYNIAATILNGAACKMFDDELRKEFDKHGVRDWFFESCKKIGYLLPKAHAVARAASAVRLAWFKLHYPFEFYAAVFENRVHDLNPDLIAKGCETVKAHVEELRELVGNCGSPVKKIRLGTYLLVWELMSRCVEMPKLVLLQR